MDLDEILHEVGEDGKYQNLMLWFVFLPIHLMFGCHAYSQLFMTWTPDHWCQIPELASANLSDHLIRHLTVPPDITSKTGYSSCSMYKLDYSIHTDHNTIILKEPNTNWTNVTCKGGWVYNTSKNWDKDTAVMKWDLVCSKGWWPVIVLSAFNASGAVGQCICLLLAKRFGKRVLFFVVLLVQSVSGVATAFSPNVICFTVFRCLVGLTIPSVLIAPSTLAFELTGWKIHAKISLLCSASRSIGMALLAGIVLFVGDWSNLALATSVPFVTFFLYCWVFPESPKWLLDTNRYEETGRQLRNIANTNGRGLSPDYVVSLKRRFRVELALQIDKQKDTGGHTLCDLLSTYNMRKKVILLIFISSCSSTACTGLTYMSVWLPSEASIQTGFALCSAAELSALALACAALRCAGRRGAALLSAVFGGALCLLHAFANPYLGWRISLILYSIAKCCSHVFSVIIPLWTREHLPSATREKGFYFIDTISLLGPIGVPIIIYQIEEYPFLPMSVFGGLLIFGAILTIGLPDTRHIKNLQTLHDAEMFGKYWKWKDYFTSGPRKTDHKNGILKSLEKKPQSPILGLLRKRDSFHLANAEGEIEVLECHFESSTLEESAVKVTVL